MTTSPDAAGPSGEGADLVRNLMDAGVALAASGDRRRMLEKILSEARRLARAEAGSLYLVREGTLRFVVAQNDRLDTPEMAAFYLDSEMPVTHDSLAGFVASTGRAVNLSDAETLDPSAPFTLNRTYDEASGYRTQSVLALPLRAPVGSTIGVLQLLNRVEEDGRVGSFPDADSGPIRSLAAMASMVLETILLQDQLHRAHLDTVVRLSIAAEVRDNETAEHLRRISATSARVAQAMAPEAQQVEMIRCASPMHDIGKIGVPDAVLHKPGPLAAEERAVMERHTLIGADILGDPQNELMAMARDIALWHHERWDGRGYPHGLAATKIPLAARIAAVADVYDALTHARCYKAAYPAELAVELIARQRGKHFDPDVVDAFLGTIGRIPEIGTTKPTPNRSDE